MNFLLQPAEIGFWGWFSYQVRVMETFTFTLLVIKYVIHFTNRRICNEFVKPIKLLRSAQLGSQELGLFLFLLHFLRYFSIP